MDTLTCNRHSADGTSCNRRCPSDEQIIDLDCACNFGHLYIGDSPSRRLTQRASQLTFLFSTIRLLHQRFCKDA